MKKTILTLLALAVWLSGCDAPTNQGGAAPCSVNTAPAGTPAYAGTNSIVITEISNSYYADVNNWIEIYNRSGASVNLANYTLVSMGVDANNLSINSGPLSFSLPNLTVAPGAYAILYTRGNPDYQGLIGTNIAVITPAGGYSPWWEDSGYLEIKNSANQTEDFVRFGANSSYAPASGGWGGNAACLTQGATSYGKSLARNLNLGDTNAGSDWTLQAFATPGGQNDVTCTNDDDFDGIPDCSEVSGSTFAGMDLFAWGARTNQKDIFVEVDWMNSVDPVIVPDATALQKVVDAFLAKGFALHIDAGANYNNIGGVGLQGNAVTYTNKVTLGAQTGYANLYALKAQNLDIRRKQIFHYALFGSSQRADAACGSSGLAELNGNDLLITFGGCAITPGQQITNMQAATFMHELGHNLGLRHGGFEDTNYKPNYISIMNYAYQLNGVPTIGSGNEALMYSYNAGPFGSCTALWDSWTNNSTTAGFVIDYSNGTSGNLLEANLSEPNGVNRAGSAALDFNCNGVTSNSGISVDINFDGAFGQTHQDHNDWANLDLFFARNQAGNSFNRTTDAVLKDPIGDDHQPLIFEKDFSHVFQAR